MPTRLQVDEARDILAHVVLCHVPVVRYNFQLKVRPAAKSDVHRACRRTERWGAGQHARLPHGRVSRCHCSSKGCYLLGSWLGANHACFLGLRPFGSGKGLHRLCGAQTFLSWAL